MTSKKLDLLLAISLLISACASPSTTATATPQPTSPPLSELFPSPTPTLAATPGPKQTSIIIDGTGLDWQHHKFLAADAYTDVPDGAVDIVSVKGFNNDQYLYIAITQQDSELAGKYAAVLRTDGDETPDFYIGFWPAESRAVFGRFDAQSFAPAVGVEVSQGEIVEIKIPLALFGGVPVLYVHLQSEYSGGSDGLDFVPEVSDEIESGGLADNSGLTTSGLITSDQTWSGEVHLTGDITFAAGVTLTIEPGTIVYLASNSDDQHNGQGHSDDYIVGHADPVGSEEWSQNAIVIDGRNGILNFVGTEEEPIVFRPEGDSASSAQWDGIYIERGTIQYAKVLYAGRTAIQALGFVGEQIEIAYNEVRYYHWAGIDSHTPNVWIHHNTVEGGGHQCITAASSNVVEYNYVSHCQNAIFIVGVDVVVRNNIAVDTARGIQIGADGRIPAGSEIAIVNNTIARVEGPPDGWYYQGALIYPAFEEGGGLEVFQPDLKLAIENNIVYGAFTWGIGLHQSIGAGSVVDYNLIWGTDANYQGNFASAAGINNLFEDPLLTFSSDGLSYELGSGSPAIDAGVPGTLDADGSPVDLGAFGGFFGADW